MNAIKKTLQALTLDQVSEIASLASLDASDEASDVLNCALQVLEDRMCESDFVRFCDKLSA